MGKNYRVTRDADLLGYDPADIKSLIEVFTQLCEMVFEETDHIAGRKWRISEQEQFMLKRVYQFRIQIREISPVIWRRIQVPEEYTFWDLHVAIQNAMEWTDSHLHEFRIRRKHAHKTIHIGYPDELAVVGDPEILPCWQIPMTAYFTDIGRTAEYLYDLGDCWSHDLLFEGILLREKGVSYPRCLGGERACPPEDCGGTRGYYSVLNVISDPEDEEYESMLYWLGGKYDPELFNPEDVKFEDPDVRWKYVFS